MSRDYAIVKPRFWTGATGKSLRGDAWAINLAAYLMTNGHAKAIGVYHLPMLYYAHESGCPFEGASKALARLIEGGFCEYDDETETVFVVNMAAHQIAEALEPGDKRVKWVQKEWESIPVDRIRASFMRVYGDRFHLVDSPQKVMPLRSPFEAPPKPGTGTGTGTGKSTRRQKPATSPLPDGFAVSDRVADWAQRKGYDRLDEHLDAFKRKATAKGYVYANWDDAFMEAIREDWAKLRGGYGRNGAAPAGERAGSGPTHGKREG